MLRSGYGDSKESDIYTSILHILLITDIPWTVADQHAEINAIGKTYLIKTPIRSIGHIDEFQTHNSEC